MKLKKIIATILLLGFINTNFAMLPAQAFCFKKKQCQPNILEVINFYWWQKFNDKHLEEYIERVNDSSEGLSAKLVKRVTASESTVLTKLQSLVFIVTAVVLILTMICVATTMTAVIAERRKEIALRKALGATNSSLVGQFMSEGLLLGAVGGIIGSILGYVFAQYVSLNVFSSVIAFRPLLIPITIIASVLVTVLACTIPVKGAVEVDPAIVLKGE